MTQDERTQEERLAAQGIDIMAYSTFRRGELVMYTFRIRNDIPQLVIELDRLKPTACVSCVIADGASIRGGAKAFFDINTMTLYQTIPQGTAPMVDLTLAGTLTGVKG